MGAAFATTTPRPAIELHRCAVETAAWVGRRVEGSAFVKAGSGHLGLGTVMCRSGRTRWGVEATRACGARVIGDGTRLDLEAE